MSKIKVYLGLPSVGSVTDAQGYALREAQEKYGDTVELVYPKQCVRRFFHDFARNEIVKDFLKTDCDVIWFLDSDVSPAPNALELVTKHYASWMIAGCPYPVFMNTAGEADPKILFCVYTKHEESFLPSDIPQEGLAFVDGLATGCLFIKREVFEKIPAPWFEFHFKPDTREPALGEDIDFCRKASNANIKFFTDFSMVCKHYKNVCLLELNNYAINMRNKAVMAYDSDVRKKVEQLESFCRKLIHERNQAKGSTKSGIVLLD